jgi:guanylate kinase
MEARGSVLVISAPSGAGKSTLVTKLLKDLAGVSFSVSCTTRRPREGEADGRDYHFIDDAAFDRMLAEEGFVEWVQVYGSRYGTARAWIEEQVERGRDALLDLETIGAKKVKELFPDAVLIFLVPPSAEGLAARLRGRGKDTEGQIATRLDYAKHELEQWPRYDYIVLNDDLESAYASLKAIVLATRASRLRMAPVAESVLATFGG